MTTIATTVSYAEIPTVRTRRAANMIRANPAIFRFEVLNPHVFASWRTELLDER